jgi:hypothetical protein
MKLKPPQEGVKQGGHRRAQGGGALKFKSSTLRLASSKSHISLVSVPGSSTLLICEESPCAMKLLVSDAEYRIGNGGHGASLVIERFPGNANEPVPLRASICGAYYLLLCCALSLLCSHFPPPSPVADTPVKGTVSHMVDIIGVYGVINLLRGRAPPVSLCLLCSV